MDQDKKNVAVAPCAGAWIETVMLGTGCRMESVAPCAGAWIETLCPRYRPYG
ncbi:hypothetical protein PITCH_A190129 [uncultured Desulfobacterium sp.]|uniref:Uncharacterized protein n=1 Tax=uncultured Desulfobacterium sp. TaxID=201089 RepID=A0A445MVT4_9BACT|nr:hypothetical protein PITCH_A190129 [uncultured Desulfobacterium sp.]